MQSTSGTLRGVGEVRDKDGNLKATFTISTDVPPEEAEQAKQLAEEVTNANSPHNRDS